MKYQYIIDVCDGCHKKHLVIIDLEHEEAKLTEPFGPNLFEWQCPNLSCTHVNTLPIAELSSVRRGP